MDSDQLTGAWKQIKGKVKQEWNKLNDNELEQINGKVEVLVGKLQEHYGYTKDQAEQEIKKFMDKMNNK